MGIEARITTAFCTVERVTSGSLTSKWEAAICRLHLRAKVFNMQLRRKDAFGTDEMPNIVVGLGVEGTKWK